MNFKELFEGVEPKMPGAPSGIQIMTPQQFVTKAGDMPGEEVDEQGVAEGYQLDEGAVETITALAKKIPGIGKYYQMAQQYKPQLIEILKTSKSGKEVKQKMEQLAAGQSATVAESGMMKQLGGLAVGGGSILSTMWMNAMGMIDGVLAHAAAGEVGGAVASGSILGLIPVTLMLFAAMLMFKGSNQSSDEKAQAFQAQRGQQGVAEGQDHLNRIRSLSGLAEATTLPASSREFGGDEFQDYMKRIVGTPDTDKAGNVKIDKKGNEKYVTGKTKTDRYKMPYIHRSSVVEYLGPDGATYDEDAVKKTLSQRPKALLKQNEKMKHSNGEFEQFFNVGFAALTGIALDEQTNKLIIVNTCPGAGSCKIDCFAMKGGKIQFKNAWQSDGRILTYLLNDPDGFFNQLSSEISKEEQAGQKGDKKFPKGWQTTIRWHDAGDFFSPEYLDLALKMAAKHPDTKFYAYTKMAGAALGQKPPNFIINWSEGAHTSQEKQVKASDANLDKTKNSRIVPDDLFQDLLVKDEKKNLVKGSEGQWQVQPDKLPELKNRLAKEYGLSANSILDYNQYMAKRKSIPAGMKYNVIVAPGEGDISANDPNIISTLLLKH